MWIPAQSSEWYQVRLDGYAFRLQEPAELLSYYVIPAQAGIHGLPKT
jgi:hypothetical protein